MPPLYPPAGPKSIGQVLDLAFRIFQVSLVRCLLFGAVSMIAGQLPNIYTIASGRPLTRFGGGDPMWAVLYVVGALITLLMLSMLLLRQHDVVTGRRRPAGVEFSAAFRRLPAVVALFVLEVLMVLIGPVAVGIVFGVARIPTSSYAAISVGALIACVPVAYLLTPFSLSMPALLLTGRGAVAAMKYGFKLVGGCWWRTTTIITIGIVITIVFYAVAMVIVGMTLPLLGAADLASVTAATAVVYVVLGAIATPFFCAVLLATFGELQVRKEGLDLEQRIGGVAQA